eukprot:gnl/TRDRNA2_/TRDRNA2_169980_c1_seq5.p1 gnl/TRDRNA2_/TRDRNA2_169980_c1~~gnl/TRDRNA2_/TRDRNA2_169980_c1_seq5.p1  ORF type:complete len:289 (-),score=59.45 gnl/TRDRNA2_/TRDRNA2_169980_c1_seq5:279-1145(-)
MFGKGMGMPDPQQAFQMPAVPAPVPAVPSSIDPETQQALLRQKLLLQKTAGRQDGLMDEETAKRQMKLERQRAEEAAAAAAEAAEEQEREEEARRKKKKKRRRSDEAQEEAIQEEAEIPTGSDTQANPPPKSQKQTPQTAPQVPLPHISPAIVGNYAAALPCKFFLKGACQKGAGCPFAHRQEDLTILDHATLEQKVPMLCKFFERDACQRGASCRFAHGRKEFEEIQRIKGGPIEPKLKNGIGAKLGDLEQATGFQSFDAFDPAAPNATEASTSVDDAFSAFLAEVG